MDSIIARELDDSWENWLRDNLKRRCNPQELVLVLLRNGFTPSSIYNRVKLWSAARPLDLERPHIVPPDGNPDYEALCRTRITRPDCGLNVQKVLTEKLQIYTIDDFLTEDQCDRIVELSAQQLRPSTLTLHEPDKSFRTSATSDLALLDHPYIKTIDEKISDAFGINLSYSEGIQAQRYEVGQQFKRHTDYFAPNSFEYAAYAGAKGQRTWTFMVYLNDTMKGGGTQFFSINKTFRPRKGTAVAWNNLNRDGSPNPHTAHCGLPVEEGHKIIITKWFRDRGVGAMMYDDDAQELRPSERQDVRIGA